jgi:4-amino-4-deoxy-L-arabinose transferase-like glycosyltransferase
MEVGDLLSHDLDKINAKSWMGIIVLTGFCIALYFVNLGQWDLWNPDEPRYAQIAVEMVKGGDWILMHNNGSMYTDKPPLFFWLIALSSYLWQGFTSFSVRFPSAFFGTLTVLLTYALGRRLYGPRTGFLSGLILATSLQFVYLSTRGSIDATLTFFTTASLLCFILWYQGWRSEGGKEKLTTRLSIYGFYGGMALATLTKGPVGFVVPLLVGLTYLVAQRDWSGLKGMKFLSGMSLFLVIVLSWYVPVIMKGGERYLNETIFLHTIDYYSKGWNHPKPVYYYLYGFSAAFLPWTFFFPAAVGQGFSKEAIEKRKEFFFLFIWFAAIFLFFSFSKGKRSLYLLPLFPAVSLMVGRLWDDLMASRVDLRKHKWISFALYGMVLLTFLGAVAIPWVTSIKLPSYFRYSLPMAFLMVGGSYAIVRLYSTRNYVATFILIAGIIAGGFFYASRIVFPVINAGRSARPICEEVISRMKPGEKLATYGFETAPFNYYTGIVPILKLDTEEAFFKFLRTPERVFCFVRYKDFVEVQKKEGKPPYQVIARRGMNRDDVVLISNE